MRKICFLLATALIIVTVSACASGPTATAASQGEVIKDGAIAVENEPASPTAESARIMVTFEGDQCSYHGPDGFPAGRITMTLDVRDQTAYAAYGFVVYTVDQGKTLADLVAAPFITHEPVWAHEQGYIERLEGGSYQEKSFLIVDGPIFLVCAVLQEGEEVRKTNVIGPIAVDSQTSGEMGIETPEMPEEWDLILFSDSSGRDVAAKYAAHIQNDLGVTINVRDMTTNALSIGQILDRLEKHEKLEVTTDMRTWINYLTEAEVVAIYANPEDSVSETNPGDWNCVSRAAGNSYYVNNCDLATFDQYIEDLSIFYEKVFEMRDGQQTIIRAFNAYVPIYCIWKSDGMFNECRQCWLNYNQAIEIAAGRYNVPVAPVFQTFNGINHDEDPRDKGYIGHDGLDTTADGSQAIANALRSLGYEITQPPED